MTFASGTTTIRFFDFPFSPHPVSTRMHISNDGRQADMGVFIAVFNLRHCRVQFFLFNIAFPLPNGATLATLLP